MPQTYELALTGFEFPRKLPRRKANFRFVADVRYVNGRGEHDTEHAVLPDLDRYWECDPERTGRPEYVRAEDRGKKGSFDMSRIDAWDRLVLLVRGDGIHSVQFKVLDVNRSDGWDRLRRALGECGGHAHRPGPGGRAGRGVDRVRFLRHRRYGSRVHPGHPSGGRRPAVVQGINGAVGSRRIRGFGAGCGGRLHDSMPTRREGGLR